ncbi:YhcH/YjgK/YiaL family protein [Pelobium manganitolerans]|uniref:YhcH/YjgK/YiaL family protein n=1 Tax=Pelobium manganitolerans TaxID=1842495 RepID=UPI003FA37A38
MIIDTLANAEKYIGVHPLFAQAFQYIKSTDLATIEVGKYEIADGLKAIVSDKPGMSAEESEAKFECHNNNIDIQVCIRGTEHIGWKTRNECKDQKGEYNPEKDVLFYNDKPTMQFTLNDNQFVVFFPEDVHAPMIGEGNIKKMVVKVRK